MENLTVETFKKKIFDYSEGGEEWSFKGTKPAILDYYASWCSPCKAIAPILEELSNEYSNIDFYKIDTEIENELALAFHIQSIPTIIFVPLNGYPQVSVGALTKDEFKKIINDIL